MSSSPGGSGAGGARTYSDFMASQRSRLVTRDLQKFKTASGTDSFHSYDPREKVRTSAPKN
jgi:hypothetical protein